jgi:hypothetical protein
MVNYHDPTTIAQEAGAHAFPSGFRKWQPDLLVSFFNSGGIEVLARHIWYIYVSPRVVPYQPGSIRLLNRDPPL